MKPLALTTLTLTAGLLGTASGGFEIKDTKGKHLDVVSDGKVLVRYMYAHDTSSAERRHETYKPYLHVFDAAGEKPITKGAGGQYTHHRGIFLGWNRLEFDGKRYDRWHMSGGEMVHEKFLRQDAGEDYAVFTSEVFWHGDKEMPLLREERSFTVSPGTGGARLLVELTTYLYADYGTVALKGDAEHAGVQYRPADEVEKKATTYVFPTEKVDLKAARDLPWVAETYVLDGKKHSVVHMNHPSNPKETLHSAYRDYGRFGAFFEKEIPEKGVLRLNYRFLIYDGELPAREEIDRAYKAFATPR